jgi:integrase
MANPPTVRIDAANEKARRGAVLPLPPDVALVLRKFLCDIPADMLLWPGRWAAQKRAGQFLKRDLEAARNEWLSSLPDNDKESAEQSDFLRYEDSDGRFADFHALRNTFLSRLGRSGASPKVMQKLARHSTVELTLGRYTHVNLHDLNAAVEALPPLQQPADIQGEPVSLKATGTTDAGASIPLDSCVSEKVFGELWLV